MLKNRFNLLTSKEWLPFQKSWFRYVNDEKLYEENLRFFTLSSAEPKLGKVFYYGPNFTLFREICKRHNLQATESTKTKLQFALIDIREEIDQTKSIADLEVLGKLAIGMAGEIKLQLADRRFVCVLANNPKRSGRYFPFAWNLAKSISGFLSLKDEKIGCLEINYLEKTDKASLCGADFFYSLYFRKDENCKDVKPRFVSNYVATGKYPFLEFPIDRWYILKPKGRSKQEILHPAKYPEDLVKMHVDAFSSPGDNVFDPMSGTGSTQVGALQNGRNAFGMELSDFFGEIANSRCAAALEPDLFSGASTLHYRIEIGDCRKMMSFNFPEIDYVITSPPYWDMLNAKGAENQAKRIEKGLQTNYSDDKNDLGNVSNYEEFVAALASIYTDVSRLMKPGAILTVVVKNIKKKGTNYPFAWDIASRLQNEFELLPETFWLQDDISIAPFGFGNTWVSNTFHQYCLNFRKIWT